MFALQVRINDGEPVICGADDLGVISAGVTGVGVLGSSSKQVRTGEDKEFFLQSGGLTSRGDDVENEHLHWGRHDLKVGDKVTIQIVEADTASPIVKSVAAKKKDKPK